MTLGSSPRVWGQDLNSILIKQIIRIIPTRVGTSNYCKTKNACVRDHPHACGDKEGEYKDFYKQKGSSPRVWGQEEKQMARRRMTRIIPTRVGTSFISSSKTAAYADHPHACGDKCTDYIYTATVLGSSPRVWGQG